MSAAYNLRNMKVTLLGTGTPTPSTRRAGSSYLLEFGAEVFMFDCGPGSHTNFLKYGMCPTQITQLFISHWHYDHFVDLPHHVLRRWDQGAGRIPELNIYGPGPIREIMEGLFGSQGVFGPDLLARTQSDLSVSIFEARGGRRPRLWPNPQVTELNDGTTTKGDGWTVSAIEVPHCQPYLRSLAYRLDGPEGCFVYSGDSGPTPRMTSFAAEADVLVHMCHYLTGTELSQGMREGCGSHKGVALLAQEARVKTLVLTHITGQIDLPGVRERMIHEISEIFSGNVILGEDLMSFESARIEAGDLL